MGIKGIKGSDPTISPLMKTVKKNLDKQKNQGSNLTKSPLNT